MLTNSQDMSRRHPTYRKKKSQQELKSRRREGAADFGNQPPSQEVLAAKKPHLMEPSIFT